MIFVRENGRTIPKEDKIFAISNRAKEAIAKYGKDNVNINFYRDKGKKEMRPEKDNMKSQMKHVDICSNDLLKKVDKPAVSFDTTLNEKLATLYKCFMRL